MNKFLFKSTEADFKKMFSITDTLQKNVLYITYRLDKCLAILNRMEADSGLKKQADEYFDEHEVEDTEHIPDSSADLD